MNMYIRNDVNAFIDDLIKTEGGYVDHPSDPGGATCWGWTAKNAEARGWIGHIADLPLKTAKSWYFEDYWMKPGFNKIHKVKPMYATELFDSGVNVGPQTSLKWLQGALNALNRQERDYPDLIVDGLIGKKTIEALKMYTTIRGKNGDIVMMRCLNGLQVAHYYNISKRNEKLEDFFFGWILNRVVM